MLEADQKLQSDLTNIRHEFGDECPANIDAGTIKGLATFGLLLLRAKYPLSCAFYDLGISRFLVPFDTISARKRVRDYINSTVDQTAMSKFQPPNIFDSNRFPPNTIVRLTPSVMARSSFFHNDSNPIPLYDHKTKIMSEEPRGWVETSMPTDKILAKLPSSYIGVIRKLPGVSDHVIFFFENNQSKIIATSVRPLVETKAIALGKETHFGIVGQFFRKVGFRIDLIASMDKAEILAIGTAKKRARVPVERTPSMARAFGPLSP